jgi:hypothetical protein
MSVDHKAEADQFLELSSKCTGDPTVWLLSAQVHATLALVEQQRIANLIAYLSNPSGDAVIVQVEEGLGL